uniref:Uncharacterized protein n=1 Tax=Romanomermis culicivorax TaxID=13658 RepID=A0A915IQ50_ROMCU
MIIFIDRRIDQYCSEGQFDPPAVRIILSVGDFDRRHFLVVPDVQCGLSNTKRCGLPLKPQERLTNL